MLQDLFTRNAHAVPETYALIDRSRRLSYDELHARACALAHGLLRLGLRPGDRVAMHLPNGIEAALVYLACFEAGLIAVPCNTRLTPRETAFALDHSQARAFVARREQCERIAPLRAELRGLERLVLVGEDPTDDDVVRFEALSACSVERVLPRVEPDAGAVIFYTSGTTARPKGVLHTHRSLWHVGRIYSEASDLRDADRVLPMSSLMHASGLVLLLGTVFVRGTAVIVPPLDPAAALDAIEQESCTHVFGLPVAYHLLVREQERTPRRVVTIRSALGAGDSVPPALSDAFRRTFGVPIHEGHGMSECAPNLVNSRAGARPGSMGRPAPSVEARVDASPGAIGELLLRTPAMFARYWRDEEETRRTFDSGFLRTGDLARVDDDGFFWFAGRRKEIIVRGGSNVSPQEVEGALCEHAAVAQAGVVGVPDRTWGEAVCAFVVLEPGAAVTSDELRAFLSERLNERKLPSSISFERDLPLGPTGKVHRRRLRARALGTTAES